MEQIREPRERFSDAVIKKSKEVVFRAKDPGSALSHFVGFLLSILLTPILLGKAAMEEPTIPKLIGLSVFMLSMIFLYGASSAYHSFSLSERGNRILRKMDHMMIFVLIAGSYTPICLLALPKEQGTKILLLVWAVAGIGMLMKAFWVTCPKWVSSVIYIGMGWICLLALPQLLVSLSGGAFEWLLLGGVFYTVGGVIYCIKSLFRKEYKYFGNHELFHLFVLAGSLCHYVLMYFYLAR